MASEKRIHLRCRHVLPVRHSLDLGDNRAMTIATRLLWIVLAVIAVAEMGMATKQFASDPSWWHQGGTACSAQDACNANR